MSEPEDITQTPFPSFVRINVTTRCDAHCRHCDIWRTNGAPDMPEAAWAPVMRSISRWLGPVEIQIAGGEPLIAPAMPRLLTLASELFLPVGIATNGWHLDNEWAARMSASKVYSVNFALDGFTALHDKMRGMPGAFQRVIEAAGRLAGLGVVRPRVTCVIMQGNLDQLLEFTEFVCRDLFDGIIFQALAWPFGSPPAPGWWEENPHWPADLDHVGHVLGKLLEMKKRGLRVLNPDEQFEAMRAYFNHPEQFTLSACTVGDTNISIEADGSVRLCPLEPAVGNVQAADLEDIWYSAEAAACRARMSRCRTNCHLLINCAFDASRLTGGDGGGR